MSTARPAASGRSALNRRLKSWPGWVLMLLVVVGFLVVGSTRSGGVRTQEDRVDEITKRIACPVCDGESVFDSQNNASRAIRNQVTDLVRQNELSDGEINDVVVNRFGADILLVPRASGFDALVWVLPVVGFAVGAVALAFAFRRWRLEAAGIPDATDADRELVAAALRDDDATDEARLTEITDCWPDPADVAADAMEPVDPDGETSS